MNEKSVSLKQALGFLREPFDKNLPLKHLFISRQIQYLFGQLKHFLHRRGIAMITGEIGAGKSTAIRAFTEQLEKNSYDIAYISDPTVGIRGIFNATARQLNLEGGYFKWQLQEKLKAAIEKNAYDFNKTTLLIIDEAQLLDTKTLEELRLFTNFKIDSQTPLNLVFLGQPDFIRTIYLNSMKALFQRINFRYHLTGLEKGEAASYISHHLKVAGRTDSIFTEEVIFEIFQQAKGIPRMINNLCYACLMEIYQNNSNLVDLPTLETVLLKWQMI
jgi:type II secretory pathway predicted ATPase ExeA